MVFYMHCTIRRCAFSLVELSIVLVILGLLVGGILGGQALIRAAELRAISSDYQRYTTAVHTFRDKYFAIPGDITNATQFWGAADGSTGLTAACYTTANTGGTATCNGNGNGRLFMSDSNATNAAPEWFRGWQHLANAGMVEGTYSAVAAGSPRLAVPGVNVPRARIKNVGFTLMSLSVPATFVGIWTGEYDGFAVGAQSPANTETANPAFRPEEAWNIDTKSDDGKPNIGLVRSAKGLPNCHVTVGSAQEYSLNATGTNCALLMSFNPPGGDGT